MTDPSYKSISDVAKELDLINKKNGKINTHTLRFWEKEFKQIKPIILSGNRRYYNNKNIKLLKLIKFLLKDRGLTIKGVKKHLINKNKLNVDEINNNHINAEKINLKSKLKKISNIIKDLKKLG